MKPSRLLLALLGTLLLSALILNSLPLLGLDLPDSLSSLGWALLLALLLLAALDAFWLSRRPSPELQRQLPGNLPLGRWSEVRLRLQHGYRQPLRVQLFDHLPEQMTAEHQPQWLELRPGQHSSLGYRLRPLRRGHFHIPCCELLLPSPLQLWQGRRYLRVSSETRVYPDFARFHGARMMAVDDWLSRLGVRQRPRRGLGLEFHQLRDFRDGDSLRQIDWKASARKGTPIAREYQDERDQHILFLLDCGRRMRSQDGELAHFDHALNASLLLSYVALRQGDAVGLATFASERPLYLAPGKGQAQLGQLLNAVYDLDSSQLPADYNSAASTLLGRQRRRALVVLVTNLRDEDDGELLTAVRRLGRQHRVLVASLREEMLDQLRHTPVSHYAQALNYCGAMEHINQRASLHERLSAAGVPVIDARPGELGPQLVSRYLALKKAGGL